MATQASAANSSIGPGWGVAARTAYNHLVLDIETRNAPEEWAEKGICADV